MKLVDRHERGVDLSIGTAGVIVKWLERESTFLIGKATSAERLLISAAISSTYNLLPPFHYLSQNTIQSSKTKSELTIASLSYARPSLNPRLPRLSPGRPVLKQPWIK